MFAPWPTMGRRVSSPCMHHASGLSHYKSETARRVCAMPPPSISLRVLSKPGRGFVNSIRGIPLLLRRLMYPKLVGELSAICAANKGEQQTIVLVRCIQCHAKHWLHQRSAVECITAMPFFVGLSNLQPDRGVRPLAHCVPNE